MITVAIPVGPHPANRRWLSECLDSVHAQTQRADVLLIDDMGQLPDFSGVSGVRMWRAPWYLGVAHAFNMGVALADDPLVFMLGSDDTLEPTCIEECLNAYYAARDDLAYYYCGVRYMDTGELQTLPCHAAMVTKALWRLTGGFPVQSSSGAPDAALLSIMIGNYPRAGSLRQVADGKPLYNYRRHAETDTASKGPWQGVILQTRDLVTREWVPR